MAMRLRQPAPWSGPLPKMHLACAFALQIGNQLRAAGIDEIHRPNPKVGQIQRFPAVFSDEALRMC